MEREGDQPEFLDHDGVMANAILNSRALRIALGPFETWSSTLRTALGIVINSKRAMLLMWGPELLSFYNDAYLPFLGTRFRDGLGMPYPEFRPDIWPIAEPFVRAAQMGEGQSARDVRYVTLRNGYEEIAYGDIDYAPVFDGPVVAGVLIHIAETTKSVLAQEKLEQENSRFRELFRLAPGFLAIGRMPELTFEFVNEAYQELVGHRDLIGKRVSTALPEAEAQGFTDLLREVARTGEPFIGHHMPFSVVTSEGVTEEKFIDFIYQPIMDHATGTVTGILCSGHDVTEEHRERTRAKKLGLELMQLTRLSAMGTMAQTLAHELNQPLTAATNYLTGIRRLIGGLDNPASNLIGAIDETKAQIRRAGEIVRRARTLLSESAPARESVRLRVVIDEAWALVRTSHECARLNVITTVLPGAENAFIDKIQFGQVLVNLLRNACQAMPSDCADPVTVTCAPEGDDFIAISVSDRGVGIPLEVSDTLFETFGKSTTGGMGIGLSLCRTIVEFHGGRIWAQTSSDGSTFTFTVPKTMSTDT